MTEELQWLHSHTNSMAINQHRNAQTQGLMRLRCSALKLSLELELQVPKTEQLFWRGYKVFQGTFRGVSAFPAPGVPFPGVSSTFGNPAFGGEGPAQSSQPSPTKEWLRTLKS